MTKVTISSCDCHEEIFWLNNITNISDIYAFLVKHGRREHEESCSEA